MSTEVNNTVDAVKKKPKRAEREIYRPGALRLLKEASNKVSYDNNLDKKDNANLPQPKKLAQFNDSEKKDLAVQINSRRSKSPVSKKDFNNSQKVFESKFKTKSHSNDFDKSHSKYAGESSESKHYGEKKNQRKFEELAESMSALLPQEKEKHNSKKFNYDCPEKLNKKYQNNEVAEVGFENYIPSIEFRKSNNCFKNVKPSHPKSYRNDESFHAKSERAKGKIEDKKFYKDDCNDLSKNRKFGNGKEKSITNFTPQKKRISNEKISKSPIDSFNNKDSYKETITPDRKQKKLNAKSSFVSPSEAKNYVECLDISSEDKTESDISPNTSMEDKTANPLAFISNQSSISSISSLEKDIDKNNESTSKVSHIPESFKDFSNKNDDRKSMNYSSNNQGKRGIIHIENSQSKPDAKNENLNVNVSHQRLLYNPNNPSKPLLIKPCSRDLPPSWENSGNVGANLYKESSPSPTNVQNVNTESEAIELDPSVIHSIKRGELDLNYFVKSNQLPQEFRRIMDIRSHLKSCYRQLLLSDVRFCQEKNFEGALWKSLYYIIIEKLREYISNDPSLKERSLSTLLMLVDEGLDYFHGLLLDLQRVYDFSLESYFEEDMTAIPRVRNRTRQALNSCQKILLSMGDLARYREQYNSNPNYVEAKR